MAVTKPDPLWAALLNSDWHDHLGTGAREDRLGNDDWLSRFLSRTGWNDQELPTDANRAELRRLRWLLRRMVMALMAGRPWRAGDLAALNRALAGAPTVLGLERMGDGWRLMSTTRARGINRVVGEVAASFANMLAKGDPRRIKICANPDCRWVIYDESRNLSRRWCDAAECGNLLKVRRHRQRKRQNN